MLPHPNTLQNLSITLSFFYLIYLLHPSLSYEISMPQTSMASTLSSSTRASDDRVTLNHQSIQVIVVQVNEHILRFLEDQETRESLRQKCTSKLKIQKQEFFEFSEHSVLSNLYWGIESVEAAIQAKWPEERISRLQSSERMLQVPALVEEHGSTGGIQNQYLICCSYFYLSLVRKLQRDDWQVTLHFLQAMLVHPQLVRKELMPELWERVFLPQIMSRRQVSGLRDMQSEPLLDCFDIAVDEATIQLARRYKDCLMYYQVMLYGETPQWNWGDRVGRPGEEARTFTYLTSSSSECMDLVEHGNGWPKIQNNKFIQDRGLYLQSPNDLTGATHNSEDVIVTRNDTNLKGEKVHPLDFQDNVTEEFGDKANACKAIHQLIRTPNQDDAKALRGKYEEGPNSNITERNMDKREDLMMISTTEVDDSKLETSDRRLQTTCSISKPECIMLTSTEATGYLRQKEAPKVYGGYCFSSKLFRSISDLDLPTLEPRDISADTSCDRLNLREPAHDFRLFDHISSQSMNTYSHTDKYHRRRLAKKIQDPKRTKNLSKACSHPEKNIHVEIMGIYEKAISTLCFSEWIGQCKDELVDVSIMWEVLNNKTEASYGLLKDEILDQLLDAISTSQEDKIVRASVFILTTIIYKNKAVVEDIKRKGLRLCDLASALKRNVHEAAILIYLINPSPTEIKTLELLPALLEVACTSNRKVPIPIQLTPLAASLMIIEVLVTAFDFTTNRMHLEAISSPPVLSRLVKAAINKNTEEITSLATILIKCMRFDGKSKMFLSQFTSMAPFIHLLGSKEKPAKITALQFFHEILQMPRSSTISLLHQIKQPDAINTTNVLMSCIQQLEPEYQILASNLLLQLDMLEDASGNNILREEVVEVLLKAIASEESSVQQVLSASVLSNLGGAYSSTGEPYTAAWLVKKIGLTSIHHKNMIRNFDWSDESLQDGGTDAWCSKVARCIIMMGEPVFQALGKGLKSKIKSVSRSCLIAITWLGCEITKIAPIDLRCTACEILLSGIEHFLHPGSDLEERLLACLSIYNYASGKEQRISCVHTQVLEAGYNCGVAASALIYYKGQLHSGHFDGSIKVWDIREQTATLVWEVKEHKKAVTCFTLSEPGDSLLSGSADRTIRVWQMVQRRLACVEVIETKEPIHKIESYKESIFALTQSRGVKVFDASRTVKRIYKSKHVKCMAVVQRKLYLGCKDSSIQEVDIANERIKEIKAPNKRWWAKNKPINDILVYRDWLYSARGVLVEGLVLKERRKERNPQMSIPMEKGKRVQAMGVVEDFIYVNCSLSPSIIEVIGEVQLLAFDTGLIKGWIPL
ncbi:hypothetical protein IFM89_023256 [Coptis chinensis]|uniref:E3 ubiquitin-protein ligase LIN-1 n=1 Tax=Coptis chinensis TaxID=261450 RepID=A0A835HZD5_9MAGN|nr:hypothetical protein IFM89_023256 [Coptis chinensis]